MTWIIEGSMKYQSDTLADEGIVISHENTFKIFVKDGVYTWTQDSRFQEQFKGIGNVLTVFVDALNKFYHKEKKN